MGLSASIIPSKEVINEIINLKLEEKEKLTLKRNQSILEEGSKKVEIEVPEGKTLFLRIDITGTFLPKEK